METDLIPVSPASHYMCGGIKINEYGNTTIKGLLAFGETTCSGVHGANRLASNSMLECLTFPYIASRAIGDYCDNFPEEKIIGFLEQAPEVSSPRTRLQKIMWDSYGINRSKQMMQKAEKSIIDIIEINDQCFCEFVSRENIEDRNLGIVAWLLAQAAITRYESRGTHKLEEYPFRDDVNWLKHIALCENEIFLKEH
jgi:L-aspartate oxidase